jgi:hypothetical protein
MYKVEAMFVAARERAASEHMTGYLVEISIAEPSRVRVEDHHVFAWSDPGSDHIRRQGVLATLPLC